MRSLAVLLLALAVPVAAQTTFTVTTTADDGAGSLRQAIVDANANAGADVIAFNIAGAGPHTITPASALPDITDPVTVDGLTQPGASCDAQPATLQIVLSDVGLRFTTDDSVIRGLVLNGGEQSTAIYIRGSRNAVECNYVGLNAAGTERVAVGRWMRLTPSVGNGQSVTCEDNRVGGASLSQRNVMAGSNFTGLGDDCLRTVIQGNYFGLNAAGTEMMGALPTAIGLSGDDTLLGGPNPGEGNVIAGNDALGSLGNVHIDRVVRVRIQGNIIGAGPDGVVIPPANGFRAGLAGITFERGGSRETEPLRYLIGGVEPGAGNLIAGHTLWGIRVPGKVNQSDTPAFAAILGNRVFDNGNPTPDPDGNLRGPPPGMDFNIDVGDRGAGASGEDNVQFPNAPDLDAKPALTTAASATVQGTLNDAPNQGYRIEVFAGEGCAPTRLAHAKYVIGAFDVTTDDSGLATFDETLATSGVPEGSVLGVTATTIVDGSAENGRTSELSACEAFPSDPLLVDRSGDLREIRFNSEGDLAPVSLLPGSLRSAIEYANATPGRDEIRFAIPMSQPNCDAETGTCLVRPMDDLPSITEAIVIDGLTQPGASCDTWPATLKVALDGSNRYGARFDSNGLQVDVESGGETVIRGLAIHDFPRSGIRIRDGAATITCNVIGTDITGTEDRGNGEGVAVFSHAARGERTSPVQIGGARVSDRNLISGNSRGILLDPFISSRILTDVVIQGNWIGTDMTGEAGIRNGFAGIAVDENVFDVQIGGESREAANVIAFNGRGGIELDESRSEPDDHPRGIAILGNAIYGNNAFTSSPGPQIELGTASLENDAGDADEGANRRQNTPAVSSAGALGFTLQVRYRVDTDPANATYPLRVEFFEAEDVAEHAGGVRYLGHDIYTTADFATGTDKEVRLLGGGTVVGGETVIATATDADGNTSPFSALALAVSDEAGAERPLELALDAPWPNPVRSTARVRYAVPDAGAVRIDLVDALGRQVRQLVDADHAPGWYPLELATGGLAPGVYMLRLSASSSQVTRTLTVVR